MHKIIYTCEGKTEKPNKRRWGNPEISKCRKLLSPLKLEGCREKPGHWSPEVELAGRNQSCGDPVLWDLQPQRSSSSWAEKEKDKSLAFSFPPDLHFSSSAFHGLQENMQTKQSRGRGRSRHLKAPGLGLAHWCWAHGRYYFPKLATTIYLVLYVFLEPLQSHIR